MAYVRQRNNQVAIVHGVRNKDTAQVEQQILFTLYSKAEAAAALGRNGHDAWGFRHLLESANPGVQFNWKSIRTGIEANLSVLPDTYDYRSARLRGGFRTSLLAFAKQLILAEPDSLPTSAELIAEHRSHLSYLKDLIDWRLKSLEDKAEPMGVDNEFFWHFACRDGEVPPETEEEAAGWYENGEHGKAMAAFTLLTEAFPDYAEGHNYLGLIALREQRLPEAIAHFEKTMEVGRRLFPKKIARSRWWSDLATRPYMRGMQNLALALTQAARNEEALKVCDRLEAECHDRITAAAHRASAHLNLGQWQAALDAARYIHQISPGESLIAAFAAFELGQSNDARALFLHASLNSPRAVAMVLRAKMPRPSGGLEAEDHNFGITLLWALGRYLNARRPASRRFFESLWRSDAVTRAREEMAGVTRRWSEDRSGKDRPAFERMTRMHTWEFAREMFPALSPGVGNPAWVDSPDLRSKPRRHGLVH